MDCRKLLWLGGILAAGLTGCMRRETAPADPFAPTAGPAPAAQSTPPRTTSSPRKGSKVVDPRPENLVKIAEVQAQAAIDTSRPAEQRQHVLQLAKSNFRRAAQIDPNFIPAYLGMAKLCSLCGEHDPAIVVLDEALAKAPNDPSLWYERGLVMGRQKRFDEALSNLLQANRLDSANVQYIKGVGLMFARVGRSEEGVSWLQRVMVEADARYNVARMMLHVGNQEEARRQFQLALRADPSHAASLTALGASPPAGPTATPEPLKLAGHAAAPAAEGLHITIDAPAPTPTLPERPAAPAPKRAAVRIGFEPGD